ncbi:MAG: TonB C-terminal domain-containing protein [Leptospiraceae bacterium]|nr:TonB C-terminal domain-containing protein [Leptospiraceae bacterium]
MITNSIETMPVENRHSKLVTSALGFLCWSSPFFGLSIFLPIGILFLYRTNHKLRSIAFHSLIFQLGIYAICYPADLICMYNESSMFCTTKMNTTGFQNEGSSLFSFLLPFFWAFVGFIVLIIEAASNYRRFGFLGSPKNNYSGREDSFLVIIFKIVISLLWAILSYSIFAVLYLPIFFKDIGFNEASIQIFFNSYFKGETPLYLWFLVIHSSARIVGRRNSLAVFRRLYLSLNIHHRLTLPSKDLESKYFQQKSKFAKFREAILPGWGVVYLQRYWQGFSLMFIYLLLLLFATTAIFFNIDYVFGIKFLQSIGLKPGIPDKEFIKYSDILFIPIFLSSMLVLVYLFSNIVLRSYLKKDTEKMEERGLSAGFRFNLAFSVLLHLILLSIVMIVPVSLQRQSGAKKNDMSKSHFQPEKMEFYFIDPEIPDEVKDLNGGVVSGTETPTENDGMKIPDEEPKDEGKVKGYVKKIKGKKLPKTYSNYISARMRGPELFMDYWRRAPHPYSCVVAYTITQDGEIIDVYLVEASNYPDQDQLTLELVQSMSPVMPPPGVKGDVRVTELFWNGPIDPDAMPTQLQKEMVMMFDGRYMEEEF